MQMLSRAVRLKIIPAEASEKDKLMNMLDQLWI